MSTPNLSQLQSNIKTVLSRRALLGQIAGLATLATVPLLAPAAAKQDNFTVDLPEYIPYGGEPNVVFYTDGYGPAERAAIIRRWYFQADLLIQMGEKLQCFFEQAHVTAPAQVDGLEFLNLTHEAYKVIEDWASNLDGWDMEKLVKAMTGKRQYLWVLKDDIQQGHSTRAEIQREIDAIREDDPDSADELQALLDAKFGGAR